MKRGLKPVTNVLEKYHSVEQPILFSAQLRSSNLENRNSSHIPSNFMNPDNNQELKVNKKGFLGDKTDVTYFANLTIHLRSIYFYNTLHREMLSYIQFLCLKERMKTKITKRK